MPWNEVRVSEERLRFVLEAIKPGRSMTALCQQFGVTRKTGYDWVSRYEEGGAAEVLTERSRRPHHSPKQASEELVTVVKTARQQRPDWGARKLSRLIANNNPTLAAIAPSTLQRILEREGLIEDRDRQQMATKRFERTRPNELWQMDFKGPQGFNKGIGPLSIQDDHSRYLLALQQMDTNNTSSVKESLQQTFEQNGLPEYMLLDHGKPWYDSVNIWGWTELTIWIMRQGIRISLCGVRHPQTQGKVERMHRALKSAIRKRKPERIEQRWLDEFRKEYNEVRPHEGIGMMLPIERWKASPRKFNPDPGDWQYPNTWECKRLAAEGQFRYQKRRWEVSGALRNQLVGLEVNGSRVVVYYCNMPVREINLATGINRHIPGNPFRLLQC